MKWWKLILLAAMPGALAGETDKAIDLGRSARADGVPSAAIYELERVASRSSGVSQINVLVELARCLIDAHREDEAASWLQKTIYRDEPEIIFWRGQARAQKGDYEGALADYTRSAGIDGKLRVEAELGRARMLEALGRPEEALEIYRKFPETNAWYRSVRLAAAAILIRQNKRDEAARWLTDFKDGSPAEKDRWRYLQGRIALESDAAEKAQRIYQELKPEDRNLAAGAVIGLADAALRSGDEDRAEALLEAFIRENTLSPLLGDVLAKLDEVYSGQKNPSNAILKQWENDDSNAALSAAATYYLARNDERQERLERAIRNYREFVQRYPEHPLRTAATIRLARLLIGSRQTSLARRVLAEGGLAKDRADRAQLRFLEGAAAYQAKDFPAAAKTFIGAANLNPKLSEAALANAAVAAISDGNEPLVAEILSALRKENAIVARRIELAEALQSARVGNPDAGEQLAWLADRRGAVGDRARFALAEWKWLANDGAGARLEFRRIANSPAAGRGDQKDYFAVYLADDGSARSADAVSSAARVFLAANPDSPREPEVRLKWGEVLMRVGDFRGARVQFDEAARSANDPALKQSAWFLAARAAIDSMNAVELDAAVQLLENVAQEKTEPLASQARLEQAMLQSALGRPKDSVTILESLVTSTRDLRLRFAARMKKGEVLLSMGAEDKTQILAAIQEWRAIAGDADALVAERNEALTRAAAASEQMGDIDAALAAYYEVLTAPRDQQPEYFWYYKAGFEAAQLLEAKKRFQEAVAIYEKMAAVPGPRANEAQERVKRLRLENFIWED